jgi:hypothetical protein
MFFDICTAHPEALLFQPSYKVSTDKAARARNQYSFHS